MLFTAGCTNAPYNELHVTLVDSISNPTESANTKADFFLAQIDQKRKSLLNISFVDRSVSLTTLEGKQSEVQELDTLEEYLKANKLGLIWLYVNHDSLFYVNYDNEGQSLILTNIKGQEQKRWRLPKMTVMGQKVYITTQSYFKPFHYFPERNEFVFALSNRYYSAEDSASFAKKNNRFTLKLENDSLIVQDFYGKIPAKHQDLFLGDFGDMYSAEYKDGIVLSYAQADSIYMYDGSERGNGYYAGAKDFSGYTSSFDYRKADNRAYLTEAERAGDKYTDLVACDNFLLRVVVRKQKPVELNEEGVNINNKIEWGFVVLDSALNYVGELDMAASGADFNAIYPYGKNKFLIRANGTRRGKFYIYEIKL